jgi:hypothetical protein
VLFPDHAPEAYHQKDSEGIERKGRTMSTGTLIIVIVVLILLFGGGGMYWRGRR